MAAGLLIKRHVSYGVTSLRNVHIPYQAHTPPPPPLPHWTQLDMNVTIK